MGRFVKILYRNWKGETTWRTIYPHWIYFGETEHHKGPQYLLYALDIDKDEYRHFAMTDILQWLNPGEVAHKNVGVNLEAD